MSAVSRTITADKASPPTDFPVGFNRINKLSVRGGSIDIGLASPGASPFASRQKTLHFDGCTTVQRETGFLEGPGSWLAVALTDGKLNSWRISDFRFEAGRAEFWVDEALPDNAAPARYHLRIVCQSVEYCDRFDLFDCLMRVVMMPALALAAIACFSYSLVFWFALWRRVDSRFYP